jgi:hypothetical protein
MRLSLKSYERQQRMNAGGALPCAQNSARAIPALRWLRKPMMGRRLVMTTSGSGNRSRSRAACYVALTLTACARIGQAHHSFAMFDFQKDMTLAGTVKEFQFTNPHCFIQLLVPGAGGGAPVEWSIEMASPPHLVRSGWTRSTVKPGDRITVVVHPLRDGAPAGSYVSAADDKGHAL